MIRAIVCVDKNWGIGKQNGLLFNIPEDMEYFKKTTVGKIVCMGYNTLLSFPNSKPLKDRKNIVLCPEGSEKNGATPVHSLEELFAELDKFKNQDIYVIGGAMFYKTMLPYCEEVLVTKVLSDGGAEVFFEDLNQSKDFELVQNNGMRKSTAGYMFCFTKYKNKHPRKWEG